MTRLNSLLVFRFVLLVLLQVLVMNNIHFLGYLNPNLYLLFVFLYPLKEKNTTFLWVCFLLGLSIDFFSNSGGINAAATVCIAYVRLKVLKVILNRKDLDLKLFQLRSESLMSILLFVGTLTFLHHFIVFSLEYYSWKNADTILHKTWTTSIFTLFLCVLSIYLFGKKKTFNF